MNRREFFATATAAGALTVTGVGIASATTSQQPVIATGMALTQKQAENFSAPAGYRLPTAEDLPTIRKAWASDDGLKTAYAKTIKNDGDGISTGDPESRYASIRMSGDQPSMANLSHALHLNPSASDNDVQPGSGMVQARAQKQLPVFLVRSV